MFGSSSNPFLVLLLLKALSLLPAMHTSEYDYLFKLLLIGDSGVGKVCSALVSGDVHSSSHLNFSLVSFCVSQTTPTLKVTSVLLVSTSRFAQ